MKRDHIAGNAKIPKVVSGCGAEKTFGMGHDESYLIEIDSTGGVSSPFRPMTNRSPIST